MLINADPTSSYYESYLFFNDSPIQSLDDYAITCFFPNMYGDGRMCLNQTLSMLQGHLYLVNSFDISTIYNFLINDYMSGGWNTDLGINCFDSIRNISSLSKEAYNTMIHGVQGNKFYPPATSPATGRTSIKKYINNFLNYFSRSAPNHIIEIISSVKEVLKSNPNHNKSTYNDIIKRIENQESPSYSFLSSYGLNSSFIQQEYRIFTNMSFLSSIKDKPEEEIPELYETISKSLITCIDSSLEEQLQKLCDPDNTYSHHTFDLENKTLYIKDENNVFFLQEDADRNYYSELFEIKQEATV